MRIIVTGATSFVGRAAADFLRKRDHEVIALRHSFEEETDKLPENADAWLHFAWAGKGSSGRSDPSVQDYNVRMTLSAVKKAAELGCARFVFAGSQAEYGHAQDGMLKKEDGDTAPVSEYGKAKLRVLNEAEKLISGLRKEGQEGKQMAYVHMRLFSVYGPGDHAGSLIDALINGLTAGEKVELGPCSQMWNYMYIDDAAEAIALITEKAGPGIINAAGPDNRRLSDYVRECREVLGGSGSVIFGARSDNAEGPADLSADISRLTGLGFDPRKAVSFREGLKKIAGLRLH